MRTARKVPVCLCPVLALVAASVTAGTVVIGERPAVEQHLDQADVDAGLIGLDVLIEHGNLLFDARFNKLDGQGRPGSTGTGAPREPDEPAFIRTSSPDSNACFGCHNQPRTGGAGDFVANVFVLAQALDPVTFSISPEFSNERNTLGMFGAGAIEMLAREMSEDLGAIRAQAMALAQSSGSPVSLPLETKGVSFGAIVAMPDGRIDPTQIEGVDWDLIVKPFHQKGAVVSLREFTNNAMNHHHGMQSTERFGENLDPDLDGVTNELTAGDITATAIFQAALPIPSRRIPAELERRQAVVQGRLLFRQIECSGCHRPQMLLRNRFFSEPNPFNPPGNLTPADVSEPFTFDLTAEGPAPRLERFGNGAIVRAFTDLKRYNLCDAELDFFCNEMLTQGTLNGFAPESDFTVAAVPRPTGQFLTRKLWDAGNSDPYGHRGDLTTMTDAIYFHGGDARTSRDAFFALSDAQQAAVIEFLKSLQVL